MKNVKMGNDFPAKCANTARGVLQDEPPGTLHRIYDFRPDLPDLLLSSGNASSCVEQILGSPRRGQDDGSLHKLPQIRFLGPVGSKIGKPGFLMSF